LELYKAEPNIRCNNLEKKGSLLAAAAALHCRGAELGGGLAFKKLNDLFVHNTQPLLSQLYERI
jgi:hypothetical protein